MQSINAKSNDKRSNSGDALKLEDDVVESGGEKGRDANRESLGKMPCCGTNKTEREIDAGSFMEDTDKLNTSQTLSSERTESDDGTALVGSEKGQTIECVSTVEGGIIERLNTGKAVKSACELIESLEATPESIKVFKLRDEKPQLIEQLEERVVKATGCSSVGPVTIEVKDRVEENSCVGVDSGDDDEPSLWSSTDNSESDDGSYTSSADETKPIAERQPRFTSIDDMILFKLLQADALQEIDKENRGYGDECAKVTQLHDGENELSPVDIISMKVDQWYRDKHLQV